jgi:hypothetical protein
MTMIRLWFISQLLALFGWLEKQLMLMLMLNCCEKKILLFH